MPESEVRDTVFTESFTHSPAHTDCRVTAPYQAADKLNALGGLYNSGIALAVFTEQIDVLLLCRVDAAPIERFMQGLRREAAVSPRPAATDSGSGRTFAHEDELLRIKIFHCRLNLRRARCAGSRLRD